MYLQWQAFASESFVCHFVLSYEANGLTNKERTDGVSTANWCLAPFF